MSKLINQLTNHILTIALLHSVTTFATSKMEVFPKLKITGINTSLSILYYQNNNNTSEALELLYKASLKNSDTLQAIKTLLKLGHVYSHQGNHKVSYDYLWSALLLADESNNESAKCDVYKDIGRHYSYYNRRDKALQFLNLSLELRKKLVSTGDSNKRELMGNYLAFVSTFRELNEWDLNTTYLDSSRLYLSSLKEKSNAMHFFKFEDAVNTNSLKQFKAAQIMFEKLVPWFEKHYPSYEVLLFNYMADNYKDLGQFKKSEEYYNRAIQISREQNAHKDFTPLIYERLSNLYYTQERYQDAYNGLKKAKELDFIYFDSRSKKNSPLLEIHDAFLKEKKLQTELAREQRLKQLEQDEQVLFLQKTILSTFIIILILFGLIYFNNIRSKHKAEKQVIKKKRELEIQKNTEIIELKNKELAASVLKLIEKDAFIETLKSKLSTGKGDIDRQEAKRILHTISGNNIENWNEFEARFVAINKSFYQNLKERFPALTLNDQRLCALVKLNFSSKDIARLLNMSTDSVHTTRSRLRKKLNLPRNMNLKQFISNI